MPSLEVDSYGIPNVTAFVDFFEQALGVADKIKSETTVEPALDESDLQDVLSRLPTAAASAESQPTTGPHQRTYPIIETAARGFLSNLIVREGSPAPGPRRSICSVATDRA